MKNILKFIALMVITNAAFASNELVFSGKIIHQAGTRDLVEVGSACEVKIIKNSVSSSNQGLEIAEGGIQVTIDDLKVVNDTPASTVMKLGNIKSKTISYVDAEGEFSLELLLDNADKLESINSLIYSTTHNRVARCEIE